MLLSILHIKTSTIFWTLIVIIIIGFIGFQDYMAHLKPASYNYVASWLIHMSYSYIYIPVQVGLKFFPKPEMKPKTRVNNLRYPRIYWDIIELVSIPVTHITLKVSFITSINWFVHSELSIWNSPYNNYCYCTCIWL